MFPFRTIVVVCVLVIVRGDCFVVVCFVILLSYKGVVLLYDLLPVGRFAAWGIVTDQAIGGPERCRCADVCGNFFEYSSAFESARRRSRKCRMIGTTH